MALRKPLSDAERQAVRRFYQNTKPTPKQAAISAWFESEYSRKLPQSTISDTLSTKYAYLDIATKASSTAFRQRPGKWPLLEKILFSWHLTPILY